MCIDVNLSANTQAAALATLLVCSHVVPKLCLECRTSCELVQLAWASPKATESDIKAQQTSIAVNS